MHHQYRTQSKPTACTHQYLVEEVLDELLLERPRGEESMKISSEKFRDEVDILKGRDEDVAKTDDVFVTEMLEQLQLSVGSLGKDRSAERLHNFLDGHSLPGKLVFGRTDETEGAHANRLQVSIPAGYLERRAKDLSAYEFGHLERWLSGSGGDH